MKYLLALITVCYASLAQAQSPETMGYLLSGGTMTVQRDGTVQAVGSTLVPTKPEKPVLRDVFYQALPPMFLQGNKFGLYYGSGLQLSGNTLTATGGTGGGGGTTYSAVAPLYVSGGTVLSIGGGTNSAGLNLGSGSLGTSGNITLSSSLATVNFGSAASIYLDGDNDLVLASKAEGAQIEITGVGSLVLTATNDFVVIGPSALDSAAILTDGNGNMYVSGTGGWNATATNTGPYSFVVSGGPVAFDHGNIITSGSGTMAMKVLQLAGTDGSFGTIAESAAGSVMTLTSTGGIVAYDRLAVSNTAATGALFSITSSAQTTYMFQDALTGLTLYPAVASNASFRFNNSLFGSTVLDIDTSNLRVGIGAIGAPKYTLDVSGGTTATGSLLLGTSGSPITLLLANSAGLVGPVTLGSNLSFSGSTLNASGGTGGGVTGLTASTGITVGSGSTPAVAVTGYFGSLPVSCISLTTTGANGLKLTGTDTSFGTITESGAGAVMTLTSSGGFNLSGGSTNSSVMTFDGLTINGNVVFSNNITSNNVAGSSLVSTGVGGNFTTATPGTNITFSANTLSAGTATFGSAAYASSGSFALSGSYVPYSSGYAVSVGAITGSNGLTISGGSTSLGNTAVSGSLTVSSGSATASTAVLINGQQSFVMINSGSFSTGGGTAAVNWNNSAMQAMTMNATGTQSVSMTAPTSGAAKLTLRLRQGPTNYPAAVTILPTPLWQNGLPYVPPQVPGQDSIINFIYDPSISKYTASWGYFY